MQPSRSPTAVCGICRVCWLRPAIHFHMRCYACFSNEIKATLHLLDWECTFFFFTLQPIYWFCPSWPKTISVLKSEAEYINRSLIKPDVLDIWKPKFITRASCFIWMIMEQMLYIYLSTALAIEHTPTEPNWISNRNGVCWDIWWIVSMQWEAVL